MEDERLDFELDPDGVAHLPEADVESMYRDLTDPVCADPVVSDRGSQVSIHGVFGEYPVEGHYACAIDGRIEYDLGVGYGGLFVVWSAEGGLQAEIAIHGSVWLSSDVCAARWSDCADCRTRLRRTSALTGDKTDW